MSANDRDTRRLAAQRTLSIRQDNFGYAIDSCNGTNSELSLSRAGQLRVSPEAITTTAGCHPDWDGPKVLQGVSADLYRGAQLLYDPQTDRLRVQGKTHTLVFDRT